MCVCVRVSVYVLSGVTPLSQVLEKKHMEVKQCSTVLFLRLKVTEVIEPCLEFLNVVLGCLHFLKNNKKTFSFFSLFS